MNLAQIAQDFRSDDDETRRAALTFLRDIKSDEAQSLLFSAMGDSSWRVRKEAVDCFICTNPDIAAIDHLLDLLRNDENAGLRNSAAEAVIRLGGRSSGPLIRRITDNDAEVRKFVIDVMGAIGDRSFVTPLVQALQDPDINVASAAAEQLGAIGDTSAAQQLMEAVLRKDDVLFRFSALGALGALGEHISVPVELIKLAEQDILKKAVFECLGAISDDSSSNLLLNGFGSRQKNCRSASLKSLYKIYLRSNVTARGRISDAIRLLKENELISGLLEIVDLRDTLLTEALMWTATTSMDSRFIPFLIYAYSDERSSFASLQALKCFGKDALQEIVSHYESLDESGRKGLCVLIAECGYSGFNNVIKDALYDTSAHVRSVAASSVGKLGLISLIPDLIRLVDDQNHQVYSAAVASLQSLVLISRSSIVSEVNRFCVSENPGHRKAAALLLASLGERDRLSSLLKDEEAQVRKAAVTAIGLNKLEAYSSMIVLALTDEDTDVRIAAAEALGNVQAESTLEALEYALDDCDVWVQSAVLNSIALIDQNRALSIIKKSYPKMSGLLMITCLKVLERIQDPNAMEIITYASSSEDIDIARQAAKSLQIISSLTPC